METKRKKRPVSEFYRTFGANLKAIRRARGLTQKDVSARLGISYQQIQKIELGTNRVSIEDLVILKEVYRVPYEAFFGKDADTPSLPILLRRIQTLPDKAMREKVLYVINVLTKY